MPGAGLVGPLAAWELRRLARRGVALRVWLLLLYTFVLVFVVFAAVWTYPRPVRDVLAGSFTPAETAAFADRFALVLLEAQLVALVALTPALAAAAVSDEKGRHTLPLLLTTQLTDREIVFGKAAGRVAFVLLVATSGLPLLLLALRLRQPGRGVRRGGGRAHLRHGGAVRRDRHSGGVPVAGPARGGRPRLRPHGGAGVRRVRAAAGVRQPVRAARARPPWR